MKKKILILGGGFGGVYTAKKLENKTFNKLEVELINNNNYFIFQPLLPEVVSGRISDSDAVIPLREILKKTYFRNAEVSKIDIKNQRVGVVQGFRKRLHWLKFDHLIIALGQESNLEIIPGLKNHAFTIRNLEDAYTLRNHILSCLELADVTKDADLKVRLLNFVVIGGGFSGVETIGETKEMIERILPYYSNINEEEIVFHLVELSNRLLPELTNDISKYVYSFFINKRIKVYLNIHIKEVTGTKAYLNNGILINTNTIISTIGSKSSFLIKESKLPMKNDKIITNEKLQVLGCSNIWSIGDSALITNKLNNKTEYALPTAQFAVAEGKTLAKNILRHELGKKLEDFSYKTKGSLASLGSRRGVGKIFFFNIKGFLAWLIWKLFYLSFIPSLPTKIRVAFGWILEIFVPRNTVMTERFKPKPVAYQYFKAGDIVFEEGMIADGFYIVTHGKFKNTYKKTKDGKEFTKIYKKGDHFGSRVILSGGRRTGTINAINDSRVLKIDKNSFRLLVENFELLGNYFDDYINTKFKNLNLEKEKKKNINV